jgi:hypothetical protein
MVNEVLEARFELRGLRPKRLMSLLMTQKMGRCVLKGNSECAFLIKYKEFGFCVSELLRHGCQECKEEEADTTTPKELEELDTNLSFEFGHIPLSQPGTA